MYSFAAASHVGNVRDNNEDSYICDTENNVWIIADGMGGLGFGEVASAISGFTIRNQLHHGHGVNQAIELAHQEIKSYALKETMNTNMGTTIVLLVCHGGLYNIFWVGDSRAYLFQPHAQRGSVRGSLRQLTTDHSLVQALVERGEITADQAKTDPRKNAVTRALGVQEIDTVRADSISDKWVPGNQILLCSDGLSDCVSDAEIESILSQEFSDQHKTDNLIRQALSNGGRDNITAVLISAPGTVCHGDSDTQIPDNLDDTYIPNST